MDLFHRYEYVELFIPSVFKGVSLPSTLYNFAVDQPNLCDVFTFVIG